MVKNHQTKWWDALFFGDGGDDDNDKIVLDPGEVEEAVSLFESPGNIDLSGLKFYADPYSAARTRNINLLPNVTTIDIAIFALPVTCDPRRKCDLTKIGVGHKRQVGNHGYGSAFTTLCDDASGRLIIEPDFFVGHHLSFEIPKQGPPLMNDEIHNRIPPQDSRIRIPNAGKNYEIIIANCNDNGRTLKIRGDVLFDYDENHFLGGQPWQDVLLNPLISLAVFLICCWWKLRIQCFPTTTSNGNIDSNNPHPHDLLPLSQTDSSLEGDEDSEQDDFDEEYSSYDDDDENDEMDRSLEMQMVDTRLMA